MSLYQRQLWEVAFANRIQGIVDTLIPIPPLLTVNMLKQLAPPSASIQAPKVEEIRDDDGGDDEVEGADVEDGVTFVYVEDQAEFSDANTAEAIGVES